MRILSLVLLFSGAMASSSSPTICSLFTSLPSGMTCTATSATNAKLEGSLGVGPWTIGGTKPFNIDISKLSLSSTAEFDVCATPATMQFDATLSIPIPNGGSLPDELNQLIDAAVKEETAGTLTWKSPNLSISRKLSMGTSDEIDLPFFFLDGLALTAKLNLALSGSISAFKVGLDLGMCIELSDKLAGLMPDGKKELCLDEMPDCTGCTAFQSCPWTEKEFPAGFARAGADTACNLLGSPNVPDLLGNPPYKILEDTYDFAKLCPLSPSPPSAPSSPATTNVVITTNALAKLLHPHIQDMRSSLATKVGVNESYVDVAVEAVDKDPTDGSYVTLSVRTAPAKAAAMAAKLKSTFSGALAATTWLAATTGLATAVVTVTSVTEASQSGTGGGMSAGAIAGIVVGSVVGIGILVGVVVKVTTKRGQPIIKETQIEDGKR